MPCILKILHKMYIKFADNAWIKCLTKFGLNISDTTCRICHRKLTSFKSSTGKTSTSAIRSHIGRKSDTDHKSVYQHIDNCYVDFHYHRLTVQELKNSYKPLKPENEEYVS